MVRVAVLNGNPCPLALTLGEREQAAAGSVLREDRRADTAMGSAEGQRRILALPEGEGRGEGNEMWPPQRSDEKRPHFSRKEPRANGEVLHPHPPAWSRCARFRLAMPAD